MKFREHRGSLNESLQTLVDLDDFDALVEHIKTLFAEMGAGAPPVNHDTVRSEFYVYDPRIKWQTWLISVDGWGPVGMTDGNPRKRGKTWSL